VSSDDYMSAQAELSFLARVRSSLGHDPEQRRHLPALFAPMNPDARRRILERVRQRTTEESKQLLNRLMDVGLPLSIAVIPLPDRTAVAAAIGKLVAAKQPEWGGDKSLVAWKHPLIDSLGLPEVLSEQSIPVHVTDLGRVDRVQLRQQAIDSFIGVTAVDYCVADTATLVIKTRPGEPRSVSLVPSIHVAVVTLRQLVRDLGELYAILSGDPTENEEGLTRCMTMISGPSKTADIELVMVHGAHGPRELFIYVITG